MKIELGSYKHSPSLSEETRAFTANIYIDGKKVGTVKNQGHGGPDQFRFDDRGVETAFFAYCKTQLYEVKTDDPDWMKDLHGTPKSAECIIGEICDELDRKKRLKTLSRKAVLFRLSGDSEDEFRTLRHRKGKKPAQERIAIREWIEKKYGDQVIEIVA